MEQDRTIDGYWDCECEGQYIHSKTVALCPRCNCRSDDMPDSMLSEVLSTQGGRNYAAV